MEIHFAPMQGYTDQTYRRRHAAMFDGITYYYTPFIRIEKGEPRRQDLRRIDREENAGVPLIPQIIFGDVTEFRTLTEAVSDAGYDRIDLNIGCPFPMQMHRGRGCQLMAEPDILAAVAEAMKEYPDIAFSLKMRAGIESPDEWEKIVDIINGMPLTHVTMHPRTARDKYSGPLHPEAFRGMTERCRHRLVYNGDLATPEDVAAIAAEYPSIDAVMTGRGLLARPSLAEEIATGRTWSEEEQRDALVALNEGIMEEYAETLCGDAQLLAKLKPLWEYAEPLIGRKIWKAIHKAGTMKAYNAAVAKIR